MAHSKTENDLSDSILAGSDEIHDFFCQPCSSKDHVEAVGYCKQCSEYFCAKCIEYHGNLSATKHHSVLDKKAMPRTKTPAKVKHRDMLTEKCRKHTDKVLEYYCHTHNQICCSVCITLDHISCSNKGYIPDMSGGIDRSQEYKQLTADLDRLITEITKRQEHINDGSRNNETYHYKSLADLQGFRKLINEHLDRIEKETKRKIAKLHQENASVIRSISEECQSLLSDVKTMTVEINNFSKSGKTNQLFVTIKLSRPRIEELEKQINKIGESQITRYAFYHDETIQQMVSTLSDIWSLSMKQHKSTMPNTSTQTDVQHTDVQTEKCLSLIQNDIPIKAQYVRKVNVKADGDRGKCFINGVAVLTKHRLVVTDEGNRNVKLIEMKVNKVVSRLYLSSLPIDITEVEPNKVAIACGIGKGNKIEMIDASDRLSITKTIRTPGAGIVGLCYNGSHFITACQKPESTCIKVIDMSGKTLNTFSTGYSGEQLSVKPSRISVRREKEVIYVSDHEASTLTRMTLSDICIGLGRNKDVIFISDLKENTITSMTLSGQVIWVYRRDELQYPTGVAVGKNDTVYVCNTRSHTITQLTPNGESAQIILGHDDRLADYPGVLAYGEEDTTLYVSSSSSAPEDRNYIRLFKLEFI